MVGQWVMPCRLSAETFLKLLGGAAIVHHARWWQLGLFMAQGTDSADRGLNTPATLLFVGP